MAVNGETAFLGPGSVIYMLSIQTVTLGSKMSISSSTKGMSLGRDYLFAWVLANGV